MNPKIINLGLQGGGAHGAFTWGVLEELLLDGRLAPHGISAASSGAMNAAVAVYGLASGGPARAVELLEKFWRRVSDIGRLGAFPTPASGLLAQATRMATGAAFTGFDMLSRLFSPYQFNPLGLNPLRAALAETVDFSIFAKPLDYALYISATDVLSGHLKIFTGAEITADAVMASACLPQLFQAVEIDGRTYWDGGFMGNPALFPLVHSAASRDILIVQINPLQRADVPKDADAILERLNEISFNTPLLAELRGIALINALLASGRLQDGEAGLRPLYLHVLTDAATLRSLPLESKYNPEWRFVNDLRDAGRAAAKAWLAENYEAVGAQGTLDLATIGH